MRLQESWMLSASPDSNVLTTEAQGKCLPALGGCAVEQSPAQLFPGYVTIDNLANILKPLIPI